jgi:murein DD-endopeptidase MepM/ murein hydrolase activator NlpD
MKAGLAVLAGGMLLAGGLAALGVVQMPGRGDSGATLAVEQAPRVPAVPAQVSWRPDPAREGTIVVMRVHGGEPQVTRASGEFAGERLHFHADSAGELTALAAAPLDSAGTLRLRVLLTHADGSRDEQDHEVTVEPGEYRMERLSVAPQFGRPQAEAIQQRMRREADRARAVSRGSHDTPRLWELPFVAPRESRITSGFGHGRMFNEHVQSRHTGTDFAGAVGTPVRAPARGIVAIVDDFYLGGGVIYIDHGAGLVTAYLHLSGKEVAEGDTVQAGHVIGRVGATGRVTGPHLHWIVRYGSHTVDGMSLLGAFGE